MTCRINRALEFCKCVPFFYTIKSVKFCDIDGLLCLSKTEWFNASSCNCMNLCESTMLTKLSSRFVIICFLRVFTNYYLKPFFHFVQQNLQFDRMLTIDLLFPKIRIERTVVFDFDDLLGEKILYAKKNLLS